ncbi:hypothetical protein [Stigmatella aurantiaca]|uniref:Uncharacterized protein n=1 Tax=Stigmatella aurantiaca (strain DW4/3-1) TaxID=378806 RepID=Q08P12_STIAD|nr:hypothetical protein [Stigmatella aurantiaca]ADO69716.1 uncharacterized protein STAUR_1912 [Stigmatella aurantiaca DW4/3-1]EAU62218.1 hypothetical protein STIAU_3562 [Stigmatella aurantiaca DW4/3-1]
MKRMVSRASFLVVALMAVAVGPLASVQAAEDTRDASSKQCLAERAGETERLQEVRMSQDSGAAPGYCTVDCSRCASTQECLSRGAGSCTAIKACRGPSQE